MSAQFAIHPFETPINHRSLLFAVFRELLEAALKDRTDVLNRACNRSEQFQFHPTIPPLDLGLFAEVAPEEIWFRMKPLEVPANCYWLGEMQSVVELQHPVPHQTSSSRGIQACGLARPKYQFLRAQVRCLFLPRRCEPDGDSALGSDGKVSRDGPWKSSDTRWKRGRRPASRDDAQQLTGCPRAATPSSFKVVRCRHLQDASSISFSRKLAHTAQGRRLGATARAYALSPVSLGRL
jgi:hypothetical protein